MRSASRWFYLVSLGFWGFALFFLLSLPSAHAANVTYETVRVGPGQYAPSGVQVPTTVNVKGPGVSKFHQIVPTATRTTIGKFGRAAIRGGGVGFAVAGIIEGLGYLVDRATGEITKVQIVPAPAPPGYVGPIDPSGGATYNCVQESLVTTIIGPDYPSAQYKYFIDLDTSSCSSGRVSFDFRYWNCPVSHPYSRNHPSFAAKCYSINEFEDTENIIDLDPSDYEIIDNALDDALTLAQKAALLRQRINQLAPTGTVSTDNYPVTITSTNINLQELYNDWPELRAALQELVNAVLAEQLALADPEFSPSPEQQTIIDQGLDSPPLAPDLELPAFCEWAEFICRPFVSTPHPDVPMLDLEVEEFDSGLPGDSSCPAPYTFETGFTGPIEISFQPACDLAAAIRVPLLAISYLMAGFIVVGVRR